MRRNYLRIAQIVAIAAAALLLLGACASDGSDTGSTTTAALADSQDDGTEGEDSSPDESGTHDEEGTSHDEGEDGTHDEEGTSHDEISADGADMVIEVDMVEFGYESEPMEIPLGSTVKFVFANTGDIEHEAVIGNHHVQDEAEEMMAEMNSGEAPSHSHDVPSITLDAGETGELVVTFDEPGELIMGCHLPGHWDSGMRADMVVV